MPQVESNGVVLDYIRSGPAGGEPLLMIHGVGAQWVRWPPALVAALETAGFEVVRFDNRDVGLSTHMTAAGAPDLAAIVAARARGEAPALPYTLSDMAADAAGLLDALGIASAHVLGVSLGGMIGQVMALEHRARLRSLTLVMSQSGDPAMPPPSPEATAVLAAPAPDPAADHEGYLRHMVALNRRLGGPLYPTSEATLRGYAEQAAARAYDPLGGARQLAAARGAADRSAVLARLDLPTLVIHGGDDPLMPAACGEALARTVPGAWLLLVHGMGHDLPDALTDLFVGAIAANARRCGTAPAA